MSEFEELEPCDNSEIIKRLENTPKIKWVQFLVYEFTFSKCSGEYKCLLTPYLGDFIPIYAPGITPKEAYDRILSRIEI